MNIKVLLVAAGCMMGTFGAYAQKGVDNGTQFGSGEDSIRCITNISLFVPYAKVGNFQDALEFWKIAYEECPAATKDLYLYGVRIVGWQIANEQDPAKRDALIDDLMAVYDKRVKYFGDDARYGKDWIVSRKAQDYLQYKGADKIDPQLMYNWLGEVVKEYGVKTEPLAASLYMFASHQLLLKDPENFKPQYVNDYLTAAGILDEQLNQAQEGGNEKEIIAITTYKTGIDNGFATSGAADCETLQNIYASKVEENKDNLEFLKETVSLLRRMRCQEIEVYFAAANYAHRIEPTAESAIGLGRQAVKAEDFDKATQYFEEAAELATEDEIKGDIYYTLALLAAGKNNYSRARQYAQRSLEANPNNGSAYLLIGKLYASTAKSVYPNDAVMAKTVYYAAVDKFERARQVDSEVAGEANTLINTYRSYFPSTEELFMHPDLDKGKQITIGGWINERTTIR
ncbi:MAG: hypothetical protein LUD02_15370 [Tannerellaceae bacterium]|nr:hypothetical protein [Tannerellaceae bacterium]